LHCFGYNRHGQCDVPAELGTVMRVATSSHQRKSTGAQASDHFRSFGAASAGRPDVFAEMGEDPSEVIQDVWHLDSAANIDPAFAVEIAMAMESGMIERQAQSAALQLEEAQQVDPQLILLQFARPTKALRDALRFGTALQQCRRALEQEGLPFELPDGNMIFVEPEDHAAARQVPATSGLKLNCFYVVVSPSMEHLIDESLAGCGKGAWARLREEMSLRDSDVATAEDSEQECASECNSLYEHLQVVRTTFHFDLHQLRNTQSVSRSTTCARAGCINPRRYS